MHWSHALLKWTALAALYLFWPGLALVVWGELTPHPPAWTLFAWEKALHFIAYFGLASMATVVLGMKRHTFWALLALAALGGVLEILQGFTGRDPAVSDEIINCTGVLSGFVVAWAYTTTLKSLAPVAQAAE